jgi:hypothetical protein
VAQLIDLGKLRFYFAGEYSTATEYELNDCVRYGGNVYVYTNEVATTGTLPTATSHWQVMVEGINFRGNYNAVTPYAVNDVVAFGGILYTCIQNSTNNVPTNTTYWEKFVDGLQYEGNYNNATPYQKNDIVTYGARAYIATATTTGNLPTNTSYWQVFADGLASLGLYNAATEYKKNDVVYLGGRTYVALRDTVGDEPGATGSGSDWAVFADGLKFRSNWNTATRYELNDIVLRGGNAYICILAHTSAGTFNADLTALKWSVYSQGFRFRGIWTPETDYLVNDLVSDGNSTFVSSADFTSGATSILDDAYWSVFALGADYLPAQVSNENKLLSTDGTDPFWSSNIDISGDVQAGGVLYLGQDAYTIATAVALPNLIGLAVGDAGGSSEEYAQFVVWNKNTDGLASTDLIVQTHDATDSDGFIDIGITGENFDSETYGITGPNDGYLFMVAPTGTTGEGNLVLATGDTGTANKIVFAAGGLTSGNTQMEIIPDTSVHIEIATASTSTTTGALVVAGGVGVQGDMNVQGDLNVIGNLALSGLDYIGVGDGAAAFGATLTNPIATFQIDADDYAQVAFRNISDAVNASTDFIAYADDGSDNDGYIDIGITSSNFADPEFTLTGAHDGYIFMNAPTGSGGAGNLVLATGANGVENKIVFAAGGLTSGNEQMIITPFQSVHVEIATESTSATTGAFTVDGGIGLTGNLNVGGNVGIVGNVDIQGQITIAGGGTTFDTANLAVVDPMIYVAQSNSDNAVDFAFVGEAAFPITPIARTVTNKVLTDNIATLTVSAAHTFQEGDYVVVAGVDATFNGTHLITDLPTASSFSFAKTATNVPAASATGTATVSNRAKYSGLAKDATDGIWKLFADASTKPANTVNFSEAGVRYDDLQLRNITAVGNVAVTGTLKQNNHDVLTNDIANAKGDIIVATAPDAMTRLGVGSNTTFIQADSAQATGLKYTSLATDTVLGAVQVTASTSRPASPSIGQLIFETDTDYINRYTSSGWKALGPVFLGFTTDDDGNLTAVTGPDGTYNVGDYTDYGILPAEMTVSVNASGQLVLTS